MDLEKIGSTMKLLRNSKDWSLEKESQMLGIHRNTLAIYEEDPEKMSIGLFKKFLFLHDISTDIFFNLLNDNSLIKSKEE